MDKEKEALLKGQAELEKKRQAIRQSQENTLASVKSLIADGNTERARIESRPLQGTALWDSVIEIFKKTGTATDNCNQCGSVIVRRFSALYLMYEKEEISCRQCREKEFIERQTARFRELNESFKASINRICARRGLPIRYSSATINTLTQKLQAMPDESIGLMITGPRGVGKTYAAAAMMRQAIERMGPEITAEGEVKIIPEGLMPLFISVPELLLEIRDSFRDDSETNERALIDKYSNIPLLILDDLGAEKTTEWALQTLYTLIDRRYRNMRRTIITTNLSLEEISSKLGDRIASRLAEMCRVIVLTGEDRRVKR